MQRNTVAYDEEQPRELLEKALVLRDAISDLPSVSSSYLKVSSSLTTQQNSNCV